MCHIVKRQLDTFLILGSGRGDFYMSIARGNYRSYTSIVIPILVATYTSYTVYLYVYY
jgi:hypothetical protein